MLLLHIGTQLPNGVLSASKSKFDDKIEASSAKMYFHYYGQLLHQQNMLQDYVRTGSTSELSCFAFLLYMINLPMFFEMGILTCKNLRIFSKKDSQFNKEQDVLFECNSSDGCL